MVTVPKILIIDDSVTSCLYMAEILQRAGYVIRTLSDGREGLMRVLQEPPDCLILDVVLPGMAGFEVCRRLRGMEVSRYLPIILVSSKNTPADRTWGLRQGANHYLPKPFTEEVLLQAVSQVLPYYKRPPTAAVRPSMAGSGYARQRPGWLKLVPHHKETGDVMWASNPRSVIISDRRARLLYAAIDGQKDLEKLCAVTQMSTEELLKALRFLLAQQRIQLYEPGGKEVDSAHFLPAR